MTELCSKGATPLTGWRLAAHKWVPRFFYKKFDGGKESGVTGYFLIEWKGLFSIGLLHFKKGSREAFHSHAFNAISWFLSGSVTEQHLNGKTREFRASLKPKLTPRSCFHKVISHSETWALTFRGPWKDVWQESRQGSLVNLTHGRQIVLDAD
jgi:hypothetical protein